MAVKHNTPLTVPLWSGRMVEWSVVAIVILILAGVFGRQIRVLQGQSELAAIKSTLGALRTALVIDYLQQTVRASEAGIAAQQHNPFLLLKEKPANYTGAFGMLEAIGAVPGSWTFDADCTCIAYQPLYPQWLESPVNARGLSFRVIGTSGPLQIAASSVYIWQGQRIN